VAFDLLIADGIDLRPLPLRHRKAMLARVGKGAKSWIALTNGIVGEGRALYRLPKRINDTLAKGRELVKQANGLK
jgi:ATP-dependent DNA ligase